MGEIRKNAIILSREEGKIIEKSMNKKIAMDEKKQKIQKGIIRTYERLLCNLLLSELYPITITKDNCRIIEYILREELLTEDDIITELLWTYDSIVAKGDNAFVNFKDLNNYSARVLLSKRVELYSDLQYGLWHTGIITRNTSMTKPYKEILKKA